MRYIPGAMRSLAAAAALAFAFGGSAAAGPAELDILKLPEWQVTSSRTAASCCCPTARDG
jgi:hypothetical protein